MPPSSGRELLIDDKVVNEWRRRLSEEVPLLMLVCEDTELLTSAAHKLCTEPRFAGTRHYRVNWSQNPNIANIVDEAGDAPAIIAANAWQAQSDSLLAALPTEKWDFESVVHRLNANQTKLLILTTPQRLCNAKFQADTSELEWTDDHIDVFEPRLRSFIAAERQAELLPEFRRQLDAGEWGSTREEQIRKLFSACKGNLAAEIERRIRSNQYALATSNEPDWGVLLSGEDSLVHLVLYVTTYFIVNETNELVAESLATVHFDAAIRLMLPLVAENIVLPNETGKETPEQRTQILVRLWLSRREAILRQCGIAPRAGVVDFIDPGWRAVVGNLIGVDYSWTFLQLSEYVRRPEFVFAHETVATGAIKAIAAYVGSNPGTLPQVLLSLIVLSGAGASGGQGSFSGEDVRGALESISLERQRTLYDWIGRLLRECALNGHVEQAEAALKKLIDLHCHAAAMSLLVRIWTAPGFKDDLGIRLTKRFLSESPGELKEAFYAELWKAVRRGDVSLIGVWRQQWLDPASPASNTPAHTAVSLIVSAGMLSVAETESADLDPVGRELMKGEPETAKDLLKWLWNPSVDEAVDDRDLASRLLYTWSLPASVRRLPSADAWPYAAGVVNCLIDGYLYSIIRSSAPQVSRQSIFRALTLTAWVGVDKDRLAPAFVEALPGILTRQKLAELKTHMFALDSAIGYTLELVVGGTIPKSREREAVRNHLKELRERFRRLRGVPAPSKPA